MVIQRESFEFKTVAMTTGIYTTNFSRNNVCYKSIKETVECHDRLHPDNTQHIKEEHAGGLKGDKGGFICQQNEIGRVLISAWTICVHFKMMPFRKDINQFPIPTLPWLWVKQWGKLGSTIYNGNYLRRMTLISKLWRRQQ